jgi:hypothetical protein
MDKFVGELLTELENYDEKVVVVMYGDHLPALEMTEADMKNNSIFQTQYTIWSNYQLKKEDKDLYAYQLSAELFDKMGYDLGVMTKYHQNYMESSTYLEGMNLLEYDMLYGKRYAFNGQNPYATTNLQMGVKPIKISEVVRVGDNLYIKGENFTGYSKISLDGEILKTIFLGPSVLGLKEEVDLDSADRMKVSQVEKNKEILSTTE